jgi:hypothetical protein
MHNVQRINYLRDNYSKTARRQWSNRSRRPPNPAVVQMHVCHALPRVTLSAPTEIIHICTWSALGRIIYTCNASLCDSARRIMHATAVCILNVHRFFCSESRRDVVAQSPWPRHSDHEPTTRAQVRRQMHASTSLLS